MRWIKEHKLVSFLCIAIILAVGFLVYSVSSGGSDADGAAGSVLGKLTQPFTTAAEKVSGGVSGIFSYKSLQKENEQLKEENQELQKKVTALTLTASQLQQLDSLKNSLNYKGAGGTTDIVSGDVTAMNGTNWMNIFTINRGSEKGVRKGSVVVSGEGLVGKVTSVGHGWAKVTSIVDATSKISFKVAGNLKILGILDSTSDGELTGFTLDSDATVSEGDTLITSGMGKYPAGIKIGTITKVTYNSNQQLQTVIVKPVVDFKALQKVSVLI